MPADVVVVENDMVDEERIAAGLNDDVDLATVAVDGPADLAAAAAGARGLVVDVNTPVDRDVIAALGDLELVARAGVGVDNVDVEAAAAHDVVVTNVPAYCRDEVATHTVSLLLAAGRRLTQLDRDVRAGGWDWSAGGEVHRLPGTTVGLVSLGPIATTVAETLAGFDVDLVCYDPYADEEDVAAVGAEKVGFEELTDRADALVVLAPLTDETRGMIDADVFAALPDHAVVVNTGRGAVVDEAALAEALAADEIAAAGIDVFETEPPTDSPLLDRDDAILTPHAGWYSEEARDELNDAVAENLAAALEGTDPPNAIDPELNWV